MLIFNHRTYKWVLPHLPFVYEIHFLFKKRIGLHCVSVLIVWVCWFHELIFSPSLKWKHKRIEFMMKKIYIHLRYMELCVCITDYDDIHKRELKDFWQLLRVLRDDSRFRNNIPWTYETKKLAFLMWELTIVWKVRDTGTSGLLLPVNCIMGGSDPSH